MTYETKNLASVDFTKETVTKPVIKSGGASSSNVLNRWVDAVMRDLALQTGRTQALAERTAIVEQLYSAQSGAQTSIIDDLVSRVEALETPEIYASIRSTTHYVSGSADVSYLFGQATLPVSERTNLLVHTDVFGNTFVSPEVAFRFATGTLPTPLDYSVDETAIETLKGLGPVVRAETQDTCWIEVMVPLEYRGSMPNVLEFYPLPQFAHDIAAVEYLPTGNGVETTWTSVDLSYLPRWNGVDEVVELAGPVRIHLPGVSMSRIRIAMLPRFSTVWGFYGFGLYHHRYETTGELVLRDPLTRELSAYTIYGKDPDVLAALPVELVNNMATISLTSNDTSSSPVITGAVFSIA